MVTFKIPTKSDLTPRNQELHDKFVSKLGYMPNVYKYMAKHPNALRDYLRFSERISFLTAKEKEAISLVVSQINNCNYCLSAHTEMAKQSGLTESEIIAITKGSGISNPKIDALVALTFSITQNRGFADAAIVAVFFEMGYTENHFIDVVFVIASKMITNFIARTAEIDIDFPLIQSV